MGFVQIFILFEFAALKNGTFDQFKQHSNKNTKTTTMTKIKFNFDSHSAKEAQTIYTKKV